MKQAGVLSVTTPSDCEIRLTRVFSAPRRMVFEALIKPEFVSRWLLGPPGWTMPVCTIDPRVGGEYRYLWRKDKGTETGMSGVFLEVKPPERLVVTERFDEAWYPGEGVNTTELEEAGEKTTLTQTVRYESKEARDAVLRTPMEEGVAAGYDRLAQILASMV